MRRASVLSVHLTVDGDSRSTQCVVAFRSGTRRKWSFLAVCITNTIGVTTRKNNGAKMIGLPIFEITAPSFNQSLCGVDEHEGATIPRNNRQHLA